MTCSAVVSSFFPFIFLSHFMKCYATKYDCIATSRCVVFSISIKSPTALELSTYHVTKQNKIKIAQFFTHLCYLLRLQSIHHISQPTFRILYSVFHFFLLQLRNEFMPGGRICHREGQTENHRLLQRRYVRHEMGFSTYTWLRKKWWNYELSVSV